MTMTRMLDDLSSIQRASLLKTKKVSSSASSLWMTDRKSSRDITSSKYFHKQSNESRSTWYLMRIRILGKKMPIQNLTLLKISKNVSDKPFHQLQQGQSSKEEKFRRFFNEHIHKINTTCKCCIIIKKQQKKNLNFMMKIIFLVMSFIYSEK